MNIKKGDSVVVITGKDKGKKGKVLTVIPKENKVVVDGLNMKTKHAKSRKRGGTGEIISISLPIHTSNVMLLDPKTGKKTRLGGKIVGDKKVRIARKSGQEI